MISELCNHVELAIAEAKAHNSKLTDWHMALDGMSSYKNRHFLNNICAGSIGSRKLRYLEVGSWKGSTFCSATFNNEIEAISIENFSEFPQTSFKGDFCPPREALYRNLELNLAFSKPKARVSMVHQDSFEVDVTKLEGLFDVYFYDGLHNYDAHYKAITHYYPALQDVSIVIIDDYWKDEVDANGKTTHAATHKAFEDLKATIVKEWFLYDPTGSTIEGAMAGWWNGIYIGVIKK